MKKFISVFAALATVLAMSFTSVAQEVEEDFSDEIVVMSVDDFTEWAEDYGCIVVSEDDNFPVPYVAKNVKLTFTDNQYQEIGGDFPLLHENVRVKVISLSSNIESVNIRFRLKKGASWTYTKNLKAGDWSNIFEVNSGGTYTVEVQPNSEPSLSSSNEGTVTVYWSDKEDW